MKSLLFLRYQSTVRWFLGGALVALSLLVSPTLQAYETNFNFDASTDPGWERWLPEFYGVNDGFGNFTNAANLPTITFITNPISAGNKALFLHVGTTNSGLTAPPVVGSFITNGAPLENFTMTVEFFSWTNGQGQYINLAGRVCLPLPPVNPPNVESTGASRYPGCLLLSYSNGRSARDFNVAKPTGASDALRMRWIYPSGLDDRGLGSGKFSGPGDEEGNPNNSWLRQTPVRGRSLSPDSTNGHYRLIFTANGLNLTGQIVDLATGLPMHFEGYDLYVYTNGYTAYEAPTNILRVTGITTLSNAGSGITYTYFLTNNGAVLSNNVFIGNYTTNLGTAYGITASLGGYGYSAPLAGDNTVGQPIDPKFDNFAIVPGVVTLESAAAVTGPYTEDPGAGIEVSPKRITIPTDGNMRFYRINWIGADHTPTITRIAFGPTVNVVTANTTDIPTVTNAVRTVVLTYN